MPNEKKTPKIAASEQTSITTAGNTTNSTLPVNHPKCNTPTKSIKQYCLECCCYSKSEVRLCPKNGIGSPICPLYPYRLGKNPNKTRRKLTDIQKNELINRLKLASKKYPVLMDEISKESKAYDAS